MFATMGYGVYLFFASMMILSIIFVYFLIPETKGVPLEATNRLFEIKPVRTANSVIMRELREHVQEFRLHIKEEGIDAAIEGDLERKHEKSHHIEVTEA